MNARFDPSFPRVNPVPMGVNSGVNSETRKNSELFVNFCELCQKKLNDINRLRVHTPVNQGGVHSLPPYGGVNRELVNFLNLGGVEHGGRRNGLATGNLRAKETVLFPTGGTKRTEGRAGGSGCMYCYNVMIISVFFLSSFFLRNRVLPGEKTMG